MKATTSKNASSPQNDPASAPNDRFLQPPASLKPRPRARCIRTGNPLQSEDGGALIEFALTVPFLATFVFGAIQACLGFYTYEWISECAREGSRYAMVHGSSCQTAAGASCTATASQVNAYVSGLGLPNLGGATETVNTTYPSGNQAPGSLVRVNITYTFPYTIPYVLTNPISMSATSEMFILQ